MSKQFSYEKLDVFPIAVELVALIDETVHLMPRGSGDMADVLQKEARSIPLYIASGSSALTKEKKLDFYHKAHQSSIQCAAILDICNRLELVDQDHLQANRDLLERVFNMVTKMIVSEG